MSFMHILGGVVIGLVVGRVFSLFSLKRICAKKYLFMLAGGIGSLSCDLLVKFLYENEYVSEFFYRQTTIVFEMIFGAAVACYILNLLGKREEIDL
mgnify:FL=1